jgi:hypothetical protein
MHVLITPTFSTIIRPQFFKVFRYKQKKEKENGSIVYVIDDFRVIKFPKIELSLI